MGLVAAPGGNAGWDHDRRSGVVVSPSEPALLIVDNHPSLAAPPLSLSGSYDRRELPGSASPSSSLMVMSMAEAH